jgi:hypothetical protein
MFTPRIDAIAKQAAVFPRAYVAGTQCKNSRRTMLHGRYPRHLQYLFEGEGKGKTECPRKTKADTPRGCFPETEADATDCTGTGGTTCGTQHLIAYWLDSTRPCNTASGGCNLPATGDGYVRLAFAKTEIAKPGQGGFSETLSKTGRGVGKVRCKNCDVPGGTSCSLGTCQTAMQGGSDPTPAIKPMFEIKEGSLLRVVHAIDDRNEPVMKQTGPSGDQFWVQKRPFFVWFGPHIPHDGPQTDDFQGIYTEDVLKLHKEERGHYKRVSWLDSVVGGLEYHLKRSCACDRNGDVKSLWENTVVIFLTDQGFLVTGAKRNSREVTQRTPLVISTPEHRGSSCTNGCRTPIPQPAVYADELASSIDVLPTILAYAGPPSGAEVRYFDGETNRSEYPHGRNLKLRIDGDSSWDSQRRKLFFGEQGTDDVSGNKDDTSGMPRHLVTRPGLLGVCQSPFDPGSGGHKHVHPCLADSDCPAGLGPCTCETSTGSCTGSTGKWKRCVNRPEAPCATDNDCAPSALCASSKCADSPSDGSFKDFVGKSCSVVGGAAPACVPPGVCRPLILKAQTENAADLSDVWDLDWDPDQTTDLLQSGYLPGGGPELRAKFVSCIAAYANLDRVSSPPSFKWIDDPNLCNSTWGLADWR